MLVEVHSENADLNIFSSLIAVLTATPDDTYPMQYQAYIEFGDGAKDLDGTGGDFQFVVTVGGQTIQPSPQTKTFSADVRSAIFTRPFLVPANKQVVVKVKSPNSADTDVDVTAYLFDAADTWVDRNTRKHIEIGGVTYQKVYKPDGTTEILSKPVKDKDGNDLVSLEVGKPAQELRS
jgi:hypothetical protein